MFYKVISNTTKTCHGLKYLEKERETETETMTKRRKKPKVHAQVFFCKAKATEKGPFSSQFFFLLFFIPHSPPFFQFSLNSPSVSESMTSSLSLR
jgi:hypothetical protein